MPCNWLNFLKRRFPSLSRDMSRRKARRLAVEVSSLETRSLLSATAVGPEVRVNTHTSLSQQFSDVAMDADGDYVVVWESDGQDGEVKGVFGRRYDFAGVPQGSEFQVNTTTTSFQRHAVAAMDADGNFVIAWESVNQDEGGAGIFARRYDSDGTPVSGEFQVNTYTVNWQSDPAIAMNPDGDFVIAWQSLYQDGDDYGVYAQRFNAAGAPQGTEFRVNTHTSDDQMQPTVAMEADGDFIIAWESYDQDGDSYGVYAQRYSVGGATVGSEFNVNTQTAGSQFAPSVAVDALGNFVFTWTNSVAGENEGDIYARNFWLAAVGPEYRVNTHTENNQRDSDIAMNAAGDFVISWSSEGQDSGTYGIYAQRYHAAGTIDGTEYRVNTQSSGSQSYPSIAADLKGDFVISWQSNEQDGSGEGVYSQRFQANQPEKIGVWRSGKYYLDSNGSNAWNGPSVDAFHAFGTAADKPIIGDWNGDGYTDIGIWRAGVFYLDSNGNGLWDGPGVDTRVAFGNASDTPVVGDWNNDGRDDLGVWRAGKFYLDLNGNRTWNVGLDGIFGFGSTNDTPLIGDWNGDGIDDLGVWRTGKFHLDLDGNRVWNSSLDGAFTFGMTTDTPLIGDYDGDGRDDLGVWRSGKFYRDMNGNRIWNAGVDSMVTFGSVSDTPLIGDWRPHGVAVTPPPASVPPLNATFARPAVAPPLASLINTTKRSRS